MSPFTFVIIDENPENAIKTKQSADCFSNLQFLGFAHSYEQAIDLVLKHLPNFIFFEVNSKKDKSNISLHFIDELHRYLTHLPKIIITSNDEHSCFKTIKYGVFDYLISPIEEEDLRKTIFRLHKESKPAIINERLVYKEKENVIAPKQSFFDDKAAPSNVVFIDNTLPEIETTTVTQPKEIGIQQNTDLILCVKSYGDYRYIDAKSIRFLTADNNSTDIHLDTGEVVTAFKTLKTFENVLKFPFFRIHHSCIANVQHISRIHTGNTTCYVKNTTTKLRFSKTYRDNIDQIIKIIASGNYIEV